MAHVKKDARRSIMDKIFGKDTSTKVDDALAEVREALDSAGVARKSYEPHMAHITKGMMEDLRDQFRDAISTITDEVDDTKLGEIANQMVAQTIGMLTQAETDMEEETMMEDEDGDLEAEIETMMNDEEDKMGDEYKSIVVGIKEAMDKQTETINALLAEKSMDYDDTFEVLKEIGQRFVTLDSRVAKIEKTFNARPRRASRAPETHVTEKEATDIKATMENGLQDTDPFWNS